MIGRTLSRYRILEPLGAGGMGEVYRARDTRLERDVAVKVLTERLAGDPESRKRFEVAFAEVGHRAEVGLLKPGDRQEIDALLAGLRDLA